MEGKTAVRPIPQLKTTTTFTPSKMRTTFTPSKMRTIFTPAPANTSYGKASSFLADPARPRSNKIYLLKKLLRGDVHAQRIALIHLAKPAWIYYLKRHDNKLVRFIEKLVAAKFSVEQSIHVTEQENMLWFKNQQQARLIWKQIDSSVLRRRMRSYIGDRCDFFESKLKKLEKRGLERLYKSVTSFRPPRECRL